MYYRYLLLTYNGRKLTHSHPFKYKNEGLEKKAVVGKNQVIVRRENANPIQLAMAKGMKETVENPLILP